MRYYVVEKTALTLADVMARLEAVNVGDLGLSPEAKGVMAGFEAIREVN